MFLRARNAKKLNAVRPKVISFYRKALRVIQELEPNHQMIWYDYLRLKYEENATLDNEKKILGLIADGEESLAWTRTILDRKK